MANNQYRWPRLLLALAAGLICLQFVLVCAHWRLGVEVFDLRKSGIHQAGGHRHRCKLPAEQSETLANSYWWLIAVDTHLSWSALTLRDPRYQRVETVREIEQLGSGRYILRDAVLSFATHDGSAPTTNASQYRIISKPHWLQRILHLAQRILSTIFLLSIAAAALAWLAATTFGQRCQAAFWKWCPARGEGTYNHSLARIAMGLTAMLSISRLAPCVRSYPESAGYYLPNGILALLGCGQPDWQTMEFVASLGLVASVLFTIGLLTRLTGAISWLGGLALASHLESFSPAWSHGYNLVFLAQFPFLFAPPGRLAVDRWIFPRQPASEPRWPAFCSALAIGLVFANAAYFKLTSGDGARLTLDWALSDNMRNVLLMQHQHLGIPLPSILQTVADYPVLYKTMALGNLVCQGGILILCLFFHRPWMRLAAGMCFAVEETGLAAVMHLFDWHWLPLALLFIDVDYFLRLRPPLQACTQLTVNWGTRLSRGVLLLFFASEYFIGFCLPADTHFQWRLYPFSQFRMYSDIKDHPLGQPRWHHIGVLFKVYDDHGQRLAAHEEELRKRFSALAANFYDESIPNWVKNIEHFTWNYLSPAPVRVQACRALFFPTAPPLKARLELAGEGLMLELEKGKPARYCGGRLAYAEKEEQRWLELQVQGHDISTLQLKSWLYDQGREIDSPFAREGHKILFTPTSGVRQAMIVVFGEIGGPEWRYMVDFTHN